MHSRTAALLTAVALVVGACGGTATPAASTAPAASAAPAASTAPATPTAPAASATPAALTGTLAVADYQYDSPVFGKALKQLDANFIKLHPGVTINHTAIPYDKWKALLQANLSAGSGPDVVMMDSGTAGVLNFSQGLVRLNDLITPQMKQELTGWPTVAENYDAANGGIYGVPTIPLGIVAYYNKKLFAQVGLDTNKGPSTYDELVAACEKFKAANITCIGGGNKEGYLSDWWFSFLWPGVGTQQDTIDLANNKLKFTDPKVKLVYQKYLDLIKAGYFDPGLTSIPLFPDSVDSFAAGKQAIFIGLSTAAASYAQFNPILGADNVGVFETVATTGAAPTYLNYGCQDAWGITTYSKVQNLAFEWIKYQTSKEGQEILFSVGGVAPNNSAAQLTGAPPQVLQMVQDVKNVGGQIQNVGHSFWKTATLTSAERQLQLAIAGQITLDQALEAIQAVQDQP